MQDTLRAIPFLSSLTDQELTVLTQHVRRKHYHKGASVFLAGEPDDCMYLIESGLVKIVSQDEQQEKFILYLGPGNFFGEGAALFGGSHSASVYVVIDATLLLLYHDDLMELLPQHPAMALTIIRELHQRLRVSLRAPIQSKELTLITTLGDATPMLAQQLAHVAGEDVLLFDLGGQGETSLDAVLLNEDHVTLVHADAALNGETLPERLSRLIKRYYWIVLWIPPTEHPLTLKAINQADLRVIVGTALVHQGQRLASGQWIEISDDPIAIHRLARRLARRQVGLALSSGNARGIAHIGVIKALHENNIPVDMIAGTSAGALFGAMYAAGQSLAEMTRFALGVPREYNFITGFRNWDFIFPPRLGLIKGDMLLNRVRELVGDKTFEELPIPLAVVAADLVSGEEIVFERGPLAEALRASMSMGGFLEPAQHDGRLLIDGGAVNPVPTQPLAARGMNLVIASNVIPTLNERLRWRRSQHEWRVANLLDSILNEREIMEGEIIRARMRPVDVLIQPEVAHYHVRQYDKARELIQAGEDATQTQIAYIRQLLAPRPRKATSAPQTPVA